MMKNIFYQMKHGTELLNYGRDRIMDSVLRYAGARKAKRLSILDIGAGSGDDLLGCAKALAGHGVESELCAIEGYAPNVQKLKERQITVVPLDIENDRFQYDDKQFDVVIMNLCLEHTKEVFHIFGEISRVLKPNGICIIGVPNLASLHNRLLLCLGKQPTSIRMFGPHVRGICKDDFIEFAEKNGYFRCVEFYGSNFYPFPPKISTVLSKYFPSLSVSIFFVLKRTNKKGSFSDILEETFFETPYKK